MDELQVSACMCVHACMSPLVHTRDLLANVRVRARLRVRTRLTACVCMRAYE